MTDIGWGRGGQGGPPWSVDLLADLQAGVPAPGAAARLWARVEADPDARAIVDALEATRSDLRQLAEARPAPMPAEFAARLDAAIASEVEARSARRVATVAPPLPPAPPGTVVDLAAARRRRNRVVGWTAGLVAAAAAAVVGIGVLTTSGAEPGAALPVPVDRAPDGDAATPPLTFKADELGPVQLDAARGANDFGPFADATRRAGCFEANGINRDATPIGGRQVVVDGRSGTLFVLSSGLGAFRLIAVEPTCGAGSPGVLADRTVGGVKPTR